MTDASAWQPVGAVDPSELQAARIAAHWASQCISACADAYLSKAEDDSHSNATWNHSLGALVGRPIGADRQVQIGLRPNDLSLVATRDDGVLSACPLADRTLADALAWTAAQVAAESDATGPQPATRDYAMPVHPVAKGAVFGAPTPAALEELAAWFANADAALARLVGDDRRASGFNIWPHHFDLGGILFLDQPSEHARQIGLGLSPGDGSYHEPYFYVTPYPVADGAELPALPATTGGHWHTEGFTGAILTGTELLAAPPANQSATVDSFLAAALSASESLL